MQKRFFIKIWRYFKKVLVLLFWLHLLYIILLKWIYPPITMTQLVSWVSGHGMNRDYVVSRKISPQVRLAVIASEDQLFPDHNGFDWKSIRKAIRYNKKKPGRIRGGSTISQQVAKNVFLWQGKSWIRKGLEVYFTYMIEFLWGKKRILDVYLNVIEMGDGIFGIEMAAYIYFGKSARELNRQEAAMIAACLPSPKRIKVKPASSFVMSRAKAIVQQMSYLVPDPAIKRVCRMPP